MDTKNITFGDWNWRIQISLSQKPYFDNVNIKKNYFGKKVLKYFIGYKDNKKKLSYYIYIASKMSWYRKILMKLNFDKLLEKYNKIWDKDFYDDGIPKEVSNCICLSIILIYCFKVGKNCYPWVCFKKNVNMLLKKKRWQDILLMT